MEICPNSTKTYYGPGSGILRLGGSFAFSLPLGPNLSQYPWLRCEGKRRKTTQPNQSDKMEISNRKQFNKKTFGSIAAWVKASFLRSLWLHDLGSTPIPLSFLRLWIRRFTMIISAWWLRTSSIFSGQELEEIHRNMDHWKLLSRCGFLQPRSRHCNEKCADRPIVSVWRCLVTGG